MDNKEMWIKTGYEIFAVSGINGLKIETLAKKVGISKSSFYHHFVDLEIFMTHLLQHHLQQSRIIGQKELACRCIDPELIEILIEHKIDLLFNRQLRVNRQQKLYYDTLVQTNQIVGNSFVMVWVKELNLKLTPRQLEAIFELALENFFLQINTDNIHQSWLSEYFTNLKRIAHNFG
ncbi:MAG: TetR/AcrR family transcriptional regulator [Microscillaceae bacterium]|jgi:AcrR family transcriptional regulator|nr:TetR/AcrR family transcriptional regulator [Microscillaceae bacterium]